jgi:hypothetical protein
VLQLRTTCNSAKPNLRNLSAPVGLWPLWQVLEHNLPIDYQHYLEHCLSQPLIRIFEAIMPDPKQVRAPLQHAPQCAHAVPHLICAI